MSYQIIIDHRIGRRLISSILDIVEAILGLEDSEEAMIVVEDQKTPDRLTLKELPKHLCYAFLGENGMKPIIISAALTEEMEHRLLEVMRINMGAFTWSVDEIKGISLSICMHKILMEDVAQPLVEHQRRLNLVMK